MDITAGVNRKLHNRAFLGVMMMVIGLALYPLSDAFIKHLIIFGGLPTTRKES